MNRALWICGPIAALLLAVHGCGSSVGGTTGTSGTGTSTSTGPAGSGTSGSSGTTGTGGSAPIAEPACSTPATPPSNGACYKGGVGTGGMDGGADGGGTGGGGNPTCNPFTGAGCAVAGGETCDFDVGDGLFHCFQPPNGAKLCEACGVDPGDGGTANYCSVGLTCLDSNKCAAFCCDDGDCGAGGTCDKTYYGDPGVGVCLEP